MQLPIVDGNVFGIDADTISHRWVPFGIHKITIVHSGHYFLPSTCCKLSYFLKIRIDDQFLTRLSLKSQFSLVLVYPSSGPNPVYSESYSNNSKGETMSSVNRKIV